jgi:hypothetical protein
MENASKALLIAGAILICILLIGVGMLIYNNAMQNIEGGMSSMDENAKLQFNTKFTQYEGKKSGANVRALIGNIITNNSTNQEVEGKLVELIIEQTSFKPTTSDLKMDEMSAEKAKINTGAQYNVVISYSKDGLVNKVTVTKVTNNNP